MQALTRTYLCLWSVRKEWSKRLVVLLSVHSKLPESMMIGSRLKIKPVWNQRAYRMSCRASSCYIKTGAGGTC